MLNIAASSVNPAFPEAKPGTLSSVFSAAVRNPSVSLNANDPSSHRAISDDLVVQVEVNNFE
jgi:hypothetical protein